MKLIFEMYLRKIFLFIPKKLLLNNLRLVDSFIDHKTVNHIYSTTLNQQ